MAIAQEKTNPNDDFLKVGPDATATFDNSASNPTEHASSENLRAAKTEDDDEVEEEDDEEEDEDEELEDEEEDEDEEDEDDDEIDDEDEDDEDDDEEDEEDEDEDVPTASKASNVYRSL